MRKIELKYLDKIAEDHIVNLNQSIYTEEYISECEYQGMPFEVHFLYNGVGLLYKIKESNHQGKIRKYILFYDKNKDGYTQREVSFQLEDIKGGVFANVSKQKVNARSVARDVQIESAGAYGGGPYVREYEHIPATEITVYNISGNFRNSLDDFLFRALEYHNRYKDFTKD